MKRANFDEAKQSQLPFAEMLVNMGYRYISVKETNRLRGEDTNKVILRETTEKKLMEINSYEKGDQKVKFTPAEISQSIDELEKINFQNGLLEVSKEKYKMLMSKSSGVSVSVGGDGKDKSQDVIFVDFKNIENNDFAFTVEYIVSNTRPDIVVFVNGIPFAVIENKKSAVSVGEAIDDLNTKQKIDKAPQLFVYAQLLVATNKSEFLYGTTDTPKKFYTRWREKDVKNVSGYISKDEEIEKVMLQEIDKDIYQNILNDLNSNTLNHSQNLERKISAQDRGLYFLFQKERLLDLESNFVLYDGKVKKIMRYQQYFGIKKIFERIKQFEDGPKGGERRKGGVVWHTQGSGKSLTMVNLAKELIEDKSIENPRIIIVTDRIDLDRQIKTTFEAADLKKKVYRIKSGEDLLDKISKKDNQILTTLVQKFDTVANKGKKFETDFDKNIFVFIDEAHRTQGGQASLKMDKYIPNACYIAFTGTPLLKVGENSDTEKRFGSFIDKYTIDDALDDGVVLPLYYDGRYANLKSDSEEIDRYIQRIIADESEENQKEIQKRIKQKMIKDNPHRIGEIAYDIERHFLEKFHDSGLKAQIVAPSQYSAILFQKYFEKNGKIKTGVVLSGTKEDESDNHKIVVYNYLKKITEKYGSKYEDNLITEFKEDDSGVEILIVVDKLLTGFDAPRNTVLYLAKDLRDHNLLQAIARINRVYENKNSAYPKTAGFVIDYSKNAENLKDAMKLFGNIKNKKDVDSALFTFNEKLEKLEESYGAVFEIFKKVKNKSDDGEYVELLDGIANEKIRKDFYNKYNAFITNFSEASIFRDFVHKFDKHEMYTNDLKFLLNLKRSVALKNPSDKLDFSKYKNAIQKILDTYVKSSEVEILTENINIADFGKEIEFLKTNKARAEAMAAKIEKTISEKKDSDPEFYEKFSERVSSIISDMYAKKMKDLEALEMLKKIDKDVENKIDISLPNKIQDIKNAGIFYRNLKKEFVEFNFSDNQYIDIVIDIMKIIEEQIIVDWQNNIDVKNRIRSLVDDYLYDKLEITDLEKSQEIQNLVVDVLLLNNVEEFKK